MKGSSPQFWKAFNRQHDRLIRSCMVNTPRVSKVPCSVKAKIASTGTTVPTGIFVVVPPPQFTRSL